MPKFPVVVLALVLGAALSSGCSSSPTDACHDEVVPGNGPLYSFVQLPDETWAFNGRLEGQGNPSGQPATRWQHRSFYPNVFYYECYNGIFPPTVNARGWSPSKAVP